MSRQVPTVLAPRGATDAELAREQLPSPSVAAAAPTSQRSPFAPAFLPRVSFLTTLCQMLLLSDDPECSLLNLSATLRFASYSVKLLARSASSLISVILLDSPVSPLSPLPSPLLSLVSALSQDPPAFVSNPTSSAYKPAMPASDANLPALGPASPASGSALPAYDSPLPAMKPALDSSNAALLATNSMLVATNAALVASNQALHASILALRAHGPDAGVQTIPVPSCTPSAGIQAPTVYHSGQPTMQARRSRVRNSNLNAAVEAWQACVPRVESSPISDEPEPILLHDRRMNYTKTGFLGEGGFGEVLLARAVPNGHFQDISFPTDVAIKKFPKKRLRHAKSALEALYLEMDLMRQATERQLRFVAHLLGAFQDDENVYLVMPAYGTDLRRHLRRVGRRMPVNEIRLYAAQMILALEEFHSLGYVHRDIKPENVFFDRYGYLVFGDFSVAGRPEGETFEQGKLYEFFGTPCRYAPEQACPDQRKKGYNYKVDIFNVGCMILEMFIGDAQSYFKESNHDDGVKEILNKDFRRDCKLFVDNKAARELVHDMLERDPAKRLTIPEIKAHRFFGKIDWDILARREYETLYRPTRPRPNKDAAKPSLTVYSCTAHSFNEARFHWECPEHLLRAEKALAGKWMDEDPTWRPLTTHRVPTPMPTQVPTQPVDYAAHGLPQFELHVNHFRARAESAA